jgi:DNA-directed RNA polymerase subunit RPC12/RpoP
MLQAKGKCPRCGKEVEFWYNMVSEDDGIFAELYDWHEGTDQIASGFSIKTEDAKCLHCGTELYVDLRVDAFITADSKFEERRVVDYDEEQELRKKAEVNYPRIFRKTHFEIDSFCADGKQLLFEGYTDDQHWNGWECPRFEKAEANRIMEASKAYGQPVTFDEATETYTYNDADSPDMEEYYKPSLIEVNGEVIKVWAVGAWCWVWDEIDDDELAELAEVERERLEEDARDVSDEMILHDLRNDEMERRCDHE